MDMGKTAGKHRFFKLMANSGLALSYNDVRLKTGYSEGLDSIRMTTLFSRRVPLNVPIVSSPMDTVTESKMAITMAKFGGIGVIHRNLTPQAQAEKVVRVKLHLNGLVSKPICVFGDETIEAIEQRRQEKGYTFQTFPVIDRQGKFIGLLTSNDYVFCENMKSLANQVMTNSVITAPSGTDLNKGYEIMKEKKKKVLPLLDNNGCVVGMYVFTDLKRIKTGNSEGYNTDPKGHLRVAASIGTGEEEMERAKLLIESGVDAIVIDTAHADSKPVFMMLKNLKETFPDTDIVVGNISEGTSARGLVEAGADGVKVGQGPGSICTTRIVAGVGCPQVTAIYNCACAIQKSQIPVCADGGITYSGDIPVAIGAGGHSVMLGRLLAGTDESPGDIVYIRGVPYKGYRGMGSLGAMQESKSSRQRYGQSNAGKDQLVPEGIEGVVPYQGSVTNLLYQYVEGLRRGMGYVGARSIMELREKADFHRISSAGLAESHPHDIDHIQDSPNYRRP